MMLKQELPYPRHLEKKLIVRLKRDLVLSAILGTALGLVLLFVALLLRFGTGRVLTNTPWYIAMVHLLTALAAFSVAFLALGRYPVLRDPASYWIGMGFAAFGIESIFFVLAWPGLSPEGQALLARMPNTSAWFAWMGLSSLSVFLLAAALSRWPGEKALPERRWLWLAAAWLGLVTLVCILSLAFESYIFNGRFVPRSGFSSLLFAWEWVFLFLFAAGAAISTRRYWLTGDVLLGYVVLAQMALVFVVLIAIVGAQRYDLWYYVSRIILVAGFLVLMFGLLSSYVSLFRREREGQVRYRQLTEALPQLIWTCTPDGYCDYFNPQWVAYTGLAVVTQPGQKWFEQLHPDDRQLAIEAWSMATTTNNNFDIELRLRRYDGQCRWFKAQVIPFHDLEGRVDRWFGSFTDIEALKQIEEDLRESEEAYRTLFESIDEGFCIIEVLFDKNELPVDYRFIETNPAFMAQTGIENAVGRRVREFAPELEDRWFDIYGKIALTGEPMRFENPAKQFNRFYDVYAFRVGDPAERKVAVLFNDISGRKQAEEDSAEFAKKLERSNWELEQFAFIASHDLQEPLRKIEAFGDILLKDAPYSDNQHSDYLERIRKAAHRMREMVDGLLFLSRINTHGQPFVLVDLSQVTKEVLSDLDHQIQRTGGQVEMDTLPVVHGDPLQLRQLLQNLIGNALKFHRPDIPPLVKLYTDQRPVTRPDSSGKPTICIYIEDNGIGFDSKDAAETLFRPFKRLVGRSEYEGTGMGLSICHRIVERHGGTITATGKPGKGATFIVTLPANGSSSLHGQPTEPI